MGIEAPRYTQTPNVFLDNMADFTPAEFKVIMAITRFTFGWHKATDRISLTQLEKITGLSRPCVIKCLARLEKDGIINKNTVEHGNEYGLIVNAVNQESGGGLTQLTSGSKLSLPEVVNSVYTQKKDQIKVKEKTPPTPQDEVPPNFYLLERGGNEQNIIHQDHPEVFKYLARIKSDTKAKPGVWQSMCEQTLNHVRTLGEPKVVELLSYTCSLSLDNPFAMYRKRALEAAPKVAPAANAPALAVGCVVQYLRQEYRVTEISPDGEFVELDSGAYLAIDKVQFVRAA